MNLFHRPPLLSDPEAFVRRAYHAVLRREADEEGLAHYTAKLRAGKLHPEQLLDALMASSEFKDATGLAGHPIYSGFQTPDVKAFTALVKSSQPLSDANLDAACVGLCGFEYYELHKRRFVEMVNFIALISKERPHPKILECGSIFSSFLIKSLFPSAKLSTIDIVELEEIGYESVFHLKDLVERHYKLDFLREQLPYVTLAEEGEFDLVLLCEVIEHLLIHPKKIFEFLLRQLKPGGFLYITTPNLFKRANVECFNRQVSPLPIYPEHYSTEDAFMFHVREYAMAELIPIAQDAGGIVSSFYFSSCWDDAETAAFIPECQLSNLILIVGKPDLPS